ncbi:MAG: CPBP family intramembrane glutamic endopeptidase [Pirellulaceae bacterium]|nr:CPBP family intramembrane metalloprotease [Planctomycetales bacterium]
MQRPFLAAAVLFEASLGLLALLLAHLLGSPWLPAHWLSPQSIVVGIAVAAFATLPTLALAILLDRSQHPSFQEVGRFVRRHLLSYCRDCSTFELALLAFAAGLGEELLFRIFLQQWLSTMLPIVAAVALAGIAFGGLHCVSPTYVLIATLMGCYLGLLLVVFHNPWVPIATHALYDWLIIRYLLATSPASDDES